MSSPSSSSPWAPASPPSIRRALPSSSSTANNTNGRYSPATGIRGGRPTSPRINQTTTTTTTATTTGGRSSSSRMETRGSNESFRGTAVGSGASSRKRQPEESAEASDSSSPSPSPTTLATPSHSPLKPANSNSTLRPPHHPRQPHHAHSHPRSHPLSSLSSRSRSRSKSRPRHSTPPIPNPHSSSHSNTLPLPLPSTPTQRSLSASASPSSYLTSSSLSTSSSSTEPRSLSVSLTRSTPISTSLSEVSVEGEVFMDDCQSERRKAGEILVELRDGLGGGTGAKRERGQSTGTVESGSGSGNEWEDHDVETEFDSDEGLISIPYIYDCTFPLSIPDLPPSQPLLPLLQPNQHQNHLPSPKNSPPTRNSRKPSSSPRLRPIPLHRRTSPARLGSNANSGSTGTFAQSFEETLTRSQSSDLPTTLQAHDPYSQALSTPTPDSTSTSISEAGTTPTPSSTTLRPTPRGRSSTSSSRSSPAGGRSRAPSTSDSGIVNAERKEGLGTTSSRPMLMSYTSFETAFDLKPPPSPPVSPKGSGFGVGAEGKSWWR